MKEPRNQDRFFPVLPSRVVIISGKGVGTSELNAFDKALIDARVGDLNLLKVSSVVPGEAKIVDGNEFPEVLNLPEGSIVPAVYSSIFSNSVNQSISACLGVGVPIDRSSGVIFEHSAQGCASDARRKVRAMINEAMNARGKSQFTSFYAESELVVPSVGFGCVVVLAVLI